MDQAESKAALEGEAVMQPEPAAADAEDGPKRERPKQEQAELTEEQAIELVAAVEELRKKRVNASINVHGWKVTWIRRKGGSTGDMCAYDPKDTNLKIFSVIGLKRRLGIAEMPPPPPRDASPAPSESGGVDTWTAEEEPGYEAGDDGAGDQQMEADGGQPGPAATGTRAGGSGTGPTRNNLTDQQMEELLTAIETMRRRGEATDEYVHGWRIVFTLRGTGAHTGRGDLMVVDPTDGQKLFSLVSLRRKLTGVGTMWEELTSKAEQQAKVNLGLDPSQPFAKRRREGVVGNDAVIFERETRRRTVVNYAEKQGAGQGSGFSTSTAIIQCLDQHAQALRPALEAVHGAAAADAAMRPVPNDEALHAAPGAASSADGPPAPAPAATVYAGLDYLSIALGVHALHHERHSAKYHSENVPIGAVRHNIGQLLKSGRLRRRMVRAQEQLQAHPASVVGEKAGTGSSMASTLQMLVLNALNVESDQGAPWVISASEFDDEDLSASEGGADGDARKDGGKSRTYVWKGVTPLHLPMNRGLTGAGLVGRRVEVWFEGAGCFYPAVVTGYNARHRATGDVDGAPGTHILVYDDGLRAVEQLEGSGEPQLWRLLEEPADLSPEDLDPVRGSDEEEDASEALGVAMEAADDGADDEPPVRVTLKCEGCVPVGSVGTAAHAARQEADRVRIASDVAASAIAAGLAAHEDPTSAVRPSVDRSLIGRRIDIYWAGDRTWYPCEVVDYVDADGSVYVRYDDRVEEYVTLRGANGRSSLEQDDWRLAASAAPRYALGSAWASEGQDAGESGLAFGERPGGESDDGGVEETDAMKVEATGEGEAAAPAGDSMSHGDAATATAAPENTGDAASFGDWRAKGPRVEMVMTLSALKGLLPLSSKEPDDFAAPTGWVEHVTRGSRGEKIAARWIRVDTSSAMKDTKAAAGSRSELEELLEEEARRRGVAWLGQLIEGKWEVRRRHVEEALGWVVGQLVGAGLATVIPGEDCGKGKDMLVAVANRYVRGDPFPRAKRPAGKEEEEEESEEEMCDFEKERQRNIQRNQELLRQLGLA